MKATHWAADNGIEYLKLCLAVLCALVSASSSSADLATNKQTNKQINLSSLWQLVRTILSPIRSSPSPSSPPPPPWWWCLGERKSFCWTPQNIIFQDKKFSRTKFSVEHLTFKQSLRLLSWGSPRAIVKFVESSVQLLNPSAPARSISPLFLFSGQEHHPRLLFFSSNFSCSFRIACVFSLIVEKAPVRPPAPGLVIL